MLITADSIVMITDVSFNGFKGCELFYTLYSDIASELEIPNNVKAFVVNKYDKRIKLSSQFIDFCKGSKFNKIMIPDLIPENIKIKESEIMGIPLCIYDKKNKGYEAYKQIYTNLVTRGVI
jgi:cellulose biosynthesis protein BcsQ